MYFPQVNTAQNISTNEHYFRCINIEAFQIIDLFNGNTVTIKIEDEKSLKKFNKNCKHNY